MYNNSPSLLNSILHWLVSGLALIITSKLISGFRIDGFGTALWGAVIIGIANVIIWPILIVLTLPINIITFGLFTFVVNGAVLKICASLLPGFTIDGWWTAILGALVLSLINTALHFLLI